GIEEFTIAIARWLFAVRGQEIGPARKQIACYVLHDDGDAVRIRIQRNMQFFIRQLSDGFVGPTFIGAKRSQRGVEDQLAQITGSGDIGRHWLFLSDYSNPWCITTAYFARRLTSGAVHGSLR